MCFICFLPFFLSQYDYILLSVCVRRELHNGIPISTYPNSCGAEYTCGMPLAMHSNSHVGEYKFGMPLPIYPNSHGGDKYAWYCWKSGQAKMACVCYWINRCKIKYQDNLWNIKSCENIFLLGFLDFVQCWNLLFEAFWMCYCIAIVLLMLFTWTSLNAQSLYFPT